MGALTFPGSAMALRPRLAFGVLAATLIQLAVALAAASAAPVASGGDAPPVRMAAASGLYFGYLVTIVMEDKNLCDLLTYCGGFAPYLTRLADTPGIAYADRYRHVNSRL